MIARREESGLTWRDLLTAGADMLEAAGVEEAGLDAWLLLSEAFGIDRTHYYIDQDRPVREERLERGLASYRDMLQARAGRIPLQQILGKTEFMGLTFAVNEHVLIPRQDTETLVEAVLDECAPAGGGAGAGSVLDLCTGSGCIAVSLAVRGRFPSVTASDISPEALKVANRNIRHLFLLQKDTVKASAEKLDEETGDSLYRVLGKDGGEREMRLLRSDLTLDLPEGEKYDIIVSNPPYIASAVIESLEPEVRDHEPRLALDGDSDGLSFYRRLASEMPGRLREGGRVYLEIGYDQGEAVGRMLEEGGLSCVRILKDLAGLDRVAAAMYKGDNHV